MKAWVMKTFAVLLPVVCLATIGYAGQTNQLDLKGKDAPRPAQTSASANSVVVRQTNAVSRVGRAEITYGGALPELRRRKTQFFRASPADRPREFQNVSVNPVTGRAEGIILFSIGF